MNNLLTRALTGFVFAVLILGSLFLSPWAVFVVLGGFTVVGLYEFHRLLNPEQPAGILYYFLGASIYVLVALVGMEVLDISNYLLVFMSFFILIGAEIFHYPSPSWKRITIGITMPMGLLNSLYFAGGSGEAFPWVLFAFFILVWANDVFAYLTGSIFGKHKLYERLSPKKTWEGSLGGLVFTLIFAWVFSLLSTSLNFSQWMGMGLIISVAANVGDLAESLLKRNAGVKDSGSFMPGHGGALDRFDAILFATPFVYFYLFVL